MQEHARGISGRRSLVFGQTVAAVLLGSVAFVRIVALLIRLIVVTIGLMRSYGASARNPAQTVRVSLS